MKTYLLSPGRFSIATEDYMIAKTEDFDFLAMSNFDENVNMAIVNMVKSTQ